MKVVFTGLPYFASQLVDDLNKFDPNNNYIFCDTYNSKWDQFRFIMHLITGASVVVSFNGVSSNSGALNWVLKLKKKLLMQWHGTDVLMVEKNKTKGCFTDKYILYASSYTDAPWLRDELASINIEAKLLHFKSMPISNSETAFKKISGFTYLAEGREVFYGLKQINELALAFPDIQFHIAGSTGALENIAGNLVFHGWVDKDEMHKLRSENPIFIRLTEHDGYALSVMESIANGNYVLWNQNHSQCELVQNSNSLISEFEKLKIKIEDSNFKKSFENIEWAKINLNREKVLTEYINTLHNFAK